jgi:hypothetical protein
MEMIMQKISDKTRQAAHIALEQWLVRVETEEPDWDMGEEFSLKFVAGFSTDSPREPNAVAVYEEAIQKALSELQNPGAAPLAAWTAAQSELERSLVTAEQVSDRYLQMWFHITSAKEL